ncbi:hypothetical protein B0H10DRAFT_2231979 [Mycena sp. CBHHK59/15]|nr:hypothetical protein B0H10DRAFT_2231979 [Mycena sp. CBHHK59/15]
MWLSAPPPMFTTPYIRANPHRFLDAAWINVPALRAFLEARDRGIAAMPNATPSRVKSEFGASDASNVSPIPLSMKIESISVIPPIRTRAFTEGNREVIELLSDSDDDDIGAPDISGPVTQTSVGDGPSRPLQINAPSRDSDQRGWRSKSNGSYPAPDLEDSDTESLRKSGTIWIDTHISSMVRKIRMNFTSDDRTHVEAMEYVTGGLPSVSPVPRIPTAFILNFSDPKFNHFDNDGNLIPVDGLIKRQDNDGWHGNSGRGDTTVDVIAVDPALVNVTRYELDITSRDAVFAALRDTRRKEGETLEQRATSFFDRVKSTPCTAKHADGRPCAGKPKLMKKNRWKSRGHGYWIACNGWTPKFQESHRTHSIPDNVDKAILVKLFDKKALANDDSLDTTPCSRIVHPHIGGKLKFCRHPHIINGQAISQCPMDHRECPSKQNYYIAVDPTIRKVLVFHPKSIPHNHPIPPLSKLSHESKAKYEQSIDAVGLLGSTVSTVDRGMTPSFVVFKRIMPGQFAPALLGKRIKRNIILEKKKKAHPTRLSITGRGSPKPLEERYIHRFHHTADGGLIIFTCFTALLSLLDDDGVKAFEDDTTFKRIAGELNEWEVVIFCNALERAITLARAYINRSDTKFFELLFDMFREIKIEATGRDIEFARFMPNGNLLVMNADMEAAQALGAARSFMKTNIPSFSGITTLDPHIFATFFVKFCSGHAKSPLQDFKSLVSADGFKRLKAFMYIDSVEELNSFRGLGGDPLQKI